MLPRFLRVGTFLDEHVVPIEDSVDENETFPEIDTRLRSMNIFWAPTCRVREHKNRRNIEVPFLRSSFEGNSESQDVSSDPKFGIAFRF